MSGPGFAGEIRSCSGSSYSGRRSTLPLWDALGPRQIGRGVLGTEVERGESDNPILFVKWLRKVVLKEKLNLTRETKT